MNAMTREEMLDIIQEQIDSGQIHEPIFLLKKLINELGGASANRTEEGIRALLMLSSCYEEIHNFSMSYLCLLLIPSEKLNTEALERLIRITPKIFKD